jgi:putative FmdB family regulatory protein
VSGFSRTDDVESQVMPLYEYECGACGHRFERIQKFSDPPVDVCPNCGEKAVHKLVSSPAIQFKGSGWYITDYARKGGDAKDSEKPATDGKTPAADNKSSAAPAAEKSTTTPDTSPASSTKTSS